LTCGRHEAKRLRRPSAHGSFTRHRVPMKLLRRQSALPHLRAFALTRAPRPLRATQRAQPLCAIHHHHIHTTGKEQEWWQERNIDLLVIAKDLWRQSRERYPTAREVDSPKSLEERADWHMEGAQAKDDSKPAVPSTGTPDTSDGVNRER
jgi:hypothetical protein